MVSMVTGASAGIGRCFAEQLAELGDDLVLVARSSRCLEELASELRQRFGVRVYPVVCDLSEPGSASRLMETVAEEKLVVHRLVNNAGFGSVGHFTDLPLERELAMIRLNIGSLVELTGLLLPSMVTRGSGEIINVSSVIASHPSPGFAVYAATKAFVTSFSSALAVELKGSGVYVQTLHPGSTATNFQSVAGSDGKTPGGQQTAEEVVRESLNARARGRGFVVSGSVNRLAYPVLNALPPLFASRLSARLLSRRTSVGVSAIPVVADDL